MRNMENIRTRAVGAGESNTPSGRNYIAEAIAYMVRKAEGNKERVYYWIGIALTISMVFVPWVKDQFIEKGREQERQAQILKVQEAQNQQNADILRGISELNKKVDDVKEKAESLEEKVNSRTSRSPRKSQQQARGKRGTMNGMQNELRADPYGLRGTTVLPRADQIPVFNKEN